jgi:DNA-directed RNA polymerase subunit RPC12/RpoP
MSDFKFSCPHCKKHIQCDEQFSGRQVQCPHCNLLIRIPAAPGKTAMYKPESGKTWDTFGPSARVAPPKGLSISRKQKPPPPK